MTDSNVQLPIGGDSGSNVPSPADVSPAPVPVVYGLTEITLPADIEVIPTFSTVPSVPVTFAVAGYNPSVSRQGLIGSSTSAPNLTPKCSISNADIGIEQGFFGLYQADGLVDLTGLAAWVGDTNNIALAVSLNMDEAVAFVAQRYGAAVVASLIMHYSIHVEPVIEPAAAVPGQGISFKRNVFKWKQNPKNKTKVNNKGAVINSQNNSSTNIVVSSGGTVILQQMPDGSVTPANNPALPNGGVSVPVALPPSGFAPLTAAIVDASTSSSSFGFNTARGFLYNLNTIVRVIAVGAVSGLLFNVVLRAAGVRTNRSVGFGPFTFHWSDDMTWKTFVGASFGVGPLHMNVLGTLIGGSTTYYLRNRAPVVSKNPLAFPAAFGSAVGSGMSLSAIANVGA